MIEDGTAYHVDMYVFFVGCYVEAEKNVFFICKYNSTLLCDRGGMRKCGHVLLIIINLLFLTLYYESFNVRGKHGLCYNARLYLMDSLAIVILCLTVHVPLKVVLAVNAYQPHISVFSETGDCEACT